MIWCGSPRDTRSTSIDVAKLAVSGECGLRSEPDVLDVNPGELRGPRDAVCVEQLQTLDDVLRACDIQAGLPREALNCAERQDVALRVSAAVCRGSIGDAEAHGLVHHQRARMAREDLGGDADGVKRLVEVEQPLRRWERCRAQTRLALAAVRWRKNWTRHRSQRKTRRRPMRPSTLVIRELHCGQVAASSRYGPSTGLTSSWIGLYLRAIAYLHVVPGNSLVPRQEHPITKRDSADIAIMASMDEMLSPERNRIACGTDLAALAQAAPQAGCPRGRDVGRPLRGRCLDDRLRRRDRPALIATPAQTGDAQTPVPRDNSPRAHAI